MLGNLDSAVAVRVGFHDEKDASPLADGRADGAEVPAEPIEINLYPGREFHVVSAEAAAP
jgi:hypothetical protein